MHDLLLLAILRSGGDGGVQVAHGGGVVRLRTRLESEEMKDNGEDAAGMTWAGRLGVGLKKERSPGRIDPVG